MDEVTVPTFVWNDLGEDVNLLQTRLGNLGGPARLDLRLNRLPLKALPDIVKYLRNNPKSSASVANNAFSFPEFFATMVQMAATDLFNAKRLTCGFTEQDMETDHLAAKALLEGRTLTLDERLDKLLALQEKNERRREQNERQHEIIRDRVVSLEGYHANGNNAIEYMVTDVVDDHMRNTLGYKLELRHQNTKLVNVHGGVVGELDGLLMYVHPSSGKKCVIMVEAKSHMNPKEFEKVGKTFRRWKELIANAEAPVDPSWHMKYRFQHTFFGLLKDCLPLVAVGSPHMAKVTVDEAKSMGYLVALNDAHQLENADAWAEQHSLCA